MPLKCDASPKVSSILQYPTLVQFNVSNVNVQTAHLNHSVELKKPLNISVFKDHQLKQQDIKINARG